MAKKIEWEADELESKIHDLAESMKRVRTAQAERDDVVVDMKNAKLSRLELLAGDLAEVVKAVPAGHDLFEFGISKGQTPRFWVDVTSFVRLVGDGREYEFVKDTYAGRVVLGRSADRGVMGKHVSDYVAERILERERVIEGEWVAARSLTEVDEQKEPQIAVTENSSENPSVIPTALFWFIVGLLLSFATLLALAANNGLQPFIAWLNALVGSN